MIKGTERGFKGKTSAPLDIDTILAVNVLLIILFNILGISWLFSIAITVGLVFISPVLLYDYVFLSFYLRSPHNRSLLIFGTIITLPFVFSELFFLYVFLGPGMIVIYHAIIFFFCLLFQIIILISAWKVQRTIKKEEKKSHAFYYYKRE